MPSDSTLSQREKRLAGALQDECYEAIDDGVEPDSVVSALEQLRSHIQVRDEAGMFEQADSVVDRLKPIDDVDMEETA